MKKTLWLSLILFFCCQKEKTTLTWQKQPTNIGFDIQALRFWDAENGLAIGGKTWGGGYVLRTQNGGQSWRFDSLYGYSFYGLNTEGGQNDSIPLAKKKIHIVGLGGHVFEYQKTDSSYRWVGQPYDAWFRDVAVRGNTGFMVGGQAWQFGKIVRFNRADGKRLQRDTFLQELNSVCFSNDSTVHAVGYGLILRSTNIGRTWTYQPDLTNDFYQSICFPSETIGYIVGMNGSILKTTDGGASWQTLKSSRAVGNPRFRSVFFADILRGWICGDNSVLWQTTDGGASWKVVTDLPQTDFYDVFTLNTEGWLAGKNGTILRFTF